VPTSFTYIVPVDKRLITLETCCGFWYGFNLDSTSTSKDVDL